MATQRLEIVRDGQKSSGPESILRIGTDGNRQTLREMAKMIRADVAEDEGVRNYAEGLIANCAEHDSECEIAHLFGYAQSIRYVSDPIWVQRVADARTTIQEQQGNCAAKVILLRTLLGAVGYDTVPVVMSFDGDLENEGYTHVFAAVQLDDGTWRALEPTDHHPEGWEAIALVTRVYDEDHDRFVSQDVYPGLSQVSGLKSQGCGCHGTCGGC